MPYMEASLNAGKKRKRHSTLTTDTSGKSKRNNNDSGDDIERLELEISQSRKHYNNIVKLLSTAFPKDAVSESSDAAVVALCRVFCRLLADGSLKSSNNMKNSEITILKWL